MIICQTVRLVLKLGKFDLFSPNHELCLKVVQNSKFPILPPTAYVQ